MATTPEEIIRSRLLASSAISNLVGANGVYPQMAPQTASLPYGILNRISELHDEHMLAASGLAEVSIQVDFFAETMSEIRTLGDAARLALDGFRGTVSGTKVHNIHLVSASDNIDTPDDGSDDPTRRTTQTYTVWIDETVPTF